MTENSIKHPDFSNSEYDLSPVPYTQVKTKFGNDNYVTSITDISAAGPRILRDKPVPKIYAAIDTDLARDNLENNLTAADIQDL